MARPIILSNGRLHVGINRYGLVHDFYYPYVGLENHAAGQSLRHHVGIWVDGNVSWLDQDADWQLSFSYPTQTLVGRTTARNDRIGILLEFIDAVDNDLDSFIRNIHVCNLQSYERDIRLFMHQAFAIGDSRSNTDTGQYLPDSDAILHYRGNRVFVVSGETNEQPFDQYTIGLFGIEGHEGTFRDADDGELSFCTVEHGRVDSTLRFKLTIGPSSSTRVHYWIAAGTTLRSALEVHKAIRTSGLDSRLHHTATCWETWAKKSEVVSQHIPLAHRELFTHSALIIKSHTDHEGAVIASTDSTMLNYSRDAYAYCWPRDGAFALWPLIRLGYTEEAQHFFDFCRRGLHPAGYLMHKYRADGSLGSSWHPYAHGNVTAPPIQEDETALVLLVFAECYKLYPHAVPLDNYYDDFVAPMANFLANYIEPVTGLPKPSYDLWEQQFKTFTYTVAVTVAALFAAAELAEANDIEVDAVAWRTAAEDMKTAAQRQLFNKDRLCFYKSVSYENGIIITDPTIDVSAVFGAFIFGLWPLTSPELEQAVQTVELVFGIDDTHIGLARYEYDDYRRSDATLLGNPWYICSLWRAQYYGAKGNLPKAERIIDWVLAQASSSGMLSEQYDSARHESVAPAPLVWSHAEYISTLLDLYGYKA